MNHDCATLIFWVDGRPDPEKVIEACNGAVPRIGEQVQLGGYGGPYEWRRVTDVVWRHNSDSRGGVSAIVMLAAKPIGHADRGPERAGAPGAHDASRPPER